ENETPKRPRPSRRVEFELEDEDEGSEDEDDDEPEGELMAQKDETQGGFLKSNNPQDAYFIAHSKVHPTSANLFSSRPNWEPFTVSSYLDALDDRPQSELADLKRICDSQCKRWPQWRAELQQGFSLLFHGVGSKRVTLNEFLEQELVKGAGWEGLVVNGFQAGSSLADVLGGLEGIVNEEAGTGGDQDPVSGRMNNFEVLEARARRLCGLLPLLSTPVCVLIHNLDGRGFRNVRAQAIISMIAAQPTIHLVATIDHVNAPLLFPSSLASARSDSCGNNFLYHHLPTYLPYTFEAILDGTLSTLLPTTIFPSTVTGTNASRTDVRQSGPTTSKAIIHVLSSLTSKAKSLFRLLAHHQLEAYESFSTTQATTLDNHLKKGTLPEETPAIAMASRALFELARTEFVASVESQMEALLVEFRDHGIITGRSEPPEGRQRDEFNGIAEDDEEWLWIGIGKVELGEVLENMDEI
ncbi:hypothetical protein CROQUDRAFT_17231, partial [Cronartium quercuum f. sp. fusiforme G11]